MNKFVLNESAWSTYGAMANKIVGFGKLTVEY